ncbi:ABC transporter permease [Natrialba sp. SSL1]|uniref:ABC transporter permease n=1 Tax=Natrialba sp. SSL1 TaxID=1869245 RepID=UPI0008F80C36|nr:ABC transporter permease [Natrialba sp. SSL1]OIB58951.1 spermidine/putrescine ABC transporter permease [Natrialba sp. SSL1]
MKLYKVAEQFAAWLVAVIVLSLLLVPIVMIVLTSLTPESFPTIPDGDVTLYWYSEMLSNTELMQALVTSFLVATCAAILSGIVGTVAAIGFVRSEISYREELATLMLLPLMISPVITGLAIIQFSSQADLPSGYPTLIIGHSILTLPYVFLIVRSRLVTFDDDLREASRVLGANGLETSLNITLPVISPTVISAMVISFVVSFGEFTATQFLIAPDATTVPVIIYTMLRAGLSPEISALSTLLIAIMVLGALISGAVTRST